MPDLLYSRDNQTPGANVFDRILSLKSIFGALMDWAFAFVESGPRTRMPLFMQPLPFARELFTRRETTSLKGAACQLRPRLAASASAARSASSSKNCGD